MYRYFLFGMILSLICSCGAIKQLPVSDDCKAITITEGDAYYELASAPYELLELRQEGNCVYIKIKYQGKLASIDLHWDKNVLERMPPQVNTNLIINTHKNNRTYIGEYSFNITSFDLKEEAFWLYFLDDENSILVKQ